MKTTENKAHVEVVTASSADLAVLRASRPDDYLGATGFSRMTVYERLQWLDMAVEFVGKVAAQRGVEKARRGTPRTPNIQRSTSNSE